MHCCPVRHEYFKRYGLDEEKLALAKADAIVMHPGPINRGIEIESSIADSERSVILQQVSHGIAVRMAIMAMTMGNQPPEKNANEQSIPSKSIG